MFLRFHFLYLKNCTVRNYDTKVTSFQSYKIPVITVELINEVKSRSTFQELCEERNHKAAKPVTSGFGSFPDFSLYVFIKALLPLLLALLLPHSARRQRNGKQMPCQRLDVICNYLGGSDVMI